MKRGTYYCYHVLLEFLPGLNIGHTLIVFEAKGRFMTFGNFIAVRIDYVEGGEYFHRMIMPANRKWSELMFFSCVKFIFIAKIIPKFNPSVLNNR